MTEQQISLLRRMEVYASRFDSAGKPEHAETIRKWMEEIRAMASLPDSQTRREG